MLSCSKPAILRRMSFNKRIPAVLILALCLLGQTASAIDVPFYNIKSGKTTLFFIENDSIYAVACPSDTVIHSRADCDLGQKGVVTKVQNATNFFLGQLPKLISVPKALSPMAVSDIEALIGVAKGVSGFSSARVLELQATISKMTDFLKKFDDSEARLKLEVAERELAGMSKHIRVTQAFDELVKSFVLLIKDKTTLSDLLESKSRDTLVGFFATAMERKLLLHRDCNSKGSSFEDIQVGTKLLLQPKDPALIAYSQREGWYGRVATVTALLSCPMVRIDLDRSEHGFDLFEYFEAE